MKTKQIEENILLKLIDLASITECPLKETLAALETIRDKAEEYAQCIRDDINGQ